MRLVVLRPRGFALFFDIVKPPVGVSRSEAEGTRTNAPDRETKRPARQTNTNEHE
jgi:hypothetical protein